MYEDKTNKKFGEKPELQQLQTRALMAAPSGGCGGRIARREHSSQGLEDMTLTHTFNCTRVVVAGYETCPQFHVREGQPWDIL